MSARDKAISLLGHYLQTAFKQAGLRWDSDNHSEIVELVDCLIQAVKESEGDPEDVRKIRKWFEEIYF